MNLVWDDYAEVWLLEVWNGHLEWDEANTNKLSKHKLTVEDVESIFRNSTLFVGRIVEPDGQSWGEDRYLNIGEDAAGKIRTVVWTVRNNLLRVISARASRTKEREVYANKKRQF